mmetsp:Transcript_4221/g.10887  ORF Transcript_4221/g.10887 Transcript_4221/m.10887 type:complete len:231 (+) Transcript_4221:588-1280(+)
MWLNNFVELVDEVRVTDGGRGEGDERRSQAAVRRAGPSGVHGPQLRERATKRVACEEHPTAPWQCMRNDGVEIVRDRLERVHHAAVAVRVLARGGRSARRHLRARPNAFASTPLPARTVPTAASARAVSGGQHVDVCQHVAQLLRATERDGDEAVRRWAGRARRTRARRPGAPRDDAAHARRADRLRDMHARSQQPRACSRRKHCAERRRPRRRGRAHRALDKPLLSNAR